MAAWSFLRAAQRDVDSIIPNASDVAMIEVPPLDMRGSG